MLEDKTGAKQKIVNFFLPCIMMFVALVSKLFGLFLVCNYSYLGDRSSVNVLINNELKSFPLFFNKKYGTKPTLMGIKFLFGDLVKLIKHLGLRVGIGEQMFSDFNDLVQLIDIIYEQYLI